MIRVARWSAFAALLAFTSWAGIEAAPPKGGSDVAGGDHITASLVAPNDGIVPGSSTLLGVVLDIDEGWYTYWRNTGDSGFAPSVTFESTPGITIGTPLWPAPHRKVMPGDLLDYVYTDHVALLFPVTVSAELEAGAVVEIRGKVKWFVCREACFVGEAPLMIRLPVRDSVERSSDAAMLDAMRSRVPVAAPSDGRITSRIVGDRLELGAPGATALAFYPYVDDEAVAQDLIRDGAVEGDLLAIRYESFGDSLAIEGVLEVKRGGELTHFKVAVPLPQ